MTTSTTITPELLDQLLADYRKPEDLLGEEGLFKQLKKAPDRAGAGGGADAIIWATRRAILPAGAAATTATGPAGKTVLTDDGHARIEMPRDRDGSFEPLLIPKHERRFNGFDDKIIAMYARGMTVREIQGYLAELYGTEVSPDLISTVTDAVLAEVTAWQTRPLEPVYPVVFFDALRVKIREDNVVRNKAVYLALGVLPTARARSWGCGSRRPRARSSG